MAADEALSERAIALHLRGSLAEAERLYQQILERQPDDCQALIMFGVLAAQTQRTQQAVDLFRRAIRADETSPLAHNNLGIVLTDLQCYEAAVASFDRAVLLSPEYADAYSNRGVTLARMKRLEQALASYDRVIELQPDSALVHNNRGSVLHQLERPGEALESYQQALVLQPEFAQAHANRADVLRELSRLPEALASADHALALRPVLPEALVAKGAVLQELQRPGDALACYEKALALQPTYVPALSHRGAALCKLQRPAEALASCDQAIALEPDSADGYVNRGMALQELQRLDDALNSYDKAITLDPQHAVVYNNRGTVLEQLQRYDEALGSFDQSIALKPDDAEPYFNKGLCLLLLGQFEPGWSLYEWRKRRRPPIAARELLQPLWLGGASLGGRTLFIHSEQGLGDTIQFCRYATLAQERGARVVLGVQPQLRRLIRSLSPTIEVIAEGDTPTAADYHCPLVSLPAAFESTAKSIPAAVPYLAAEPQRVARWRRRLGNDGFKVGICWQGNPGKVDVGRSFPLATFRRLSTIAGVRLISLQKHHDSGQVQAMPAGMHVEILGDDFDSGPDAFLDAAAVMANLDLIITSDTAIAHLAGALARPTWVVLKQVPDWRWMLERHDSPWYPTARLYRQKRTDDWDDVIQRVSADLLQLVA